MAGAAQKPLLPDAKAVPTFAELTAGVVPTFAELTAGAEQELAWRGILGQTIYYQPVGSVQKNGKTGKGFGIFSVTPADKKTLPEDMVPHAQIYARKTWTVKGSLITDPQPGMEVLCQGTVEEDPKFGRQFHARVLVETIPDVRDMAHIERWLSRKTGTSRHRIVGMTAKRAQKAAAHFQEDILNAMTDPVRLREIFPEKVCQDMAESFLRESRTYRLNLFFLDHELHQGQVHAVLGHLEELTHKNGQTWSIDAVIARTRKNPYWLTDVKGVGFLVADKLALSLGLAEDDPYRMMAGLRYALELREQEGHTATRVPDLIALAGGEKVLRVTQMQHPVKAQQVLQGAWNQWVADPNGDGKDILHWDIPAADGFSVETWVSRAVCGYSERMVARRILEMSQQASVLKSTTLQSAFSMQNAATGVAHTAGDEIILSGSQRAAILQACSKSVGILTGGPGTGKTTCLDTVAHAAMAQGLRVVLCAPSGKAASRIKQATGLDGKTIHRLLVLGPEGAAKYNADNPYPADLFIVDESSMVDVYLAAHLLQGIPRGASLLLVGDEQQLPSVGPGRIFADIIASGVAPVGKLTENHRQGGASDIAIGATRVVNGRLPQSTPKYNGCPDVPLPDATDFFAVQWVERPSGDEDDVDDIPNKWAEQRVRSALHDDIRALVDRGVPVESIQVLTPQNPGALGVRALSRDLSPVLNALTDALKLEWPASCRNPLEMGEWDDAPIPWRVGDRV
ncbi:MAG: AAA family ATPase, partial [Burkholderiales bacterium]